MERQVLYIKILGTTEFGVTIVAKNFENSFKWFSRDYNSPIWFLNEWTKVSAEVDIPNRTLKRIRVLKK